ncbi:hypothetical protein AGLY_016774 [Aphis glycines]|uniref:Uncharacterized protein n=1 Tax=Aphis glycines TaxID=307491 RepID=A0A6G0SX21_APHGL|nr:hypothetical protein AGLY_016774 [Aphis glycines]
MNYFTDAISINNLLININTLEITKFFDCCIDNKLCTNITVYIIIKTSSVLINNHLLFSPLTQAQPGTCHVVTVPKFHLIHWVSNMHTSIYQSHFQQTNYNERLLTMLKHRIRCLQVPENCYWLSILRSYKPYKGGRSPHRPIYVPPLKISVILFDNLQFSTLVWHCCLAFKHFSKPNSNLIYKVNFHTICVYKLYGVYRRLRNN